MSHKKWLREMKAKDDKHQATFTNNANLKEHLTTKSTIIEGHSMTEPFACPFCLGLHQLQKYLISTSKGYHKGLGKCPECGNQCKLTSLTANWTPEQYAEWVYPYRLSGFWQKVPFNKWRERLMKIGWSYRFWKRYKELKGEDTDRPLTVIEKQEQARYECQKCGEQNEKGTTFCKYCGFRLIESYG